MPKKLLNGIGIALLIGISAIGILTFRQRHENKELIPSTPAASENVSPETKPAEPTFDKKKFSNDAPESIWVVVNKKRALNPTSYTPSDLVSVGNNQRLRSEAANALSLLIADAKTQGLTIQPLSGYRSYATQVQVYNNEVAAYGQAVADTESARPGYSEHQTGLAIDIGGGGCGIEDCFGETNEGKWVAEHAYEYGYLIRYTAPKQSITGYRAEPWHIRYVGKELSKELKKQNITTLEEFLNLL
jgi:D-alanyl-D-alanine carboxypeptidase